MNNIAPVNEEVATIEPDILATVEKTSVTARQTLEQKYPAFSWIWNPPPLREEEPEIIGDRTVWSRGTPDSLFAKEALASYTCNGGTLFVSPK